MAGEGKMVTVGEIYLKSDPSSGHMVILKEHEEAERHLVMFVGQAEFTAIAKEKGLVELKRPITHELYLRIMEELQAEFRRVEVTHMEEDTIYAKVIFRTGSEEHAVDSRPSDAIALGLNRKVPILVNEDLLRRQLKEEDIREYKEFVKRAKFKGGAPRRKS
jgi:hypothetical protein